MENKITIGFASKIEPVKPINDQFTLCKCYVMAVGENHNKSNISKEAVEKALPTIFNIPVVGHLFVDDEDETRMGGHDRELKKGSDGKYSVKTLTVPFGVVPQQENIHFEDVVEKDGKTNTYLVGDIILWTGRYPEMLSAKYNEEVYFNQSMEILTKDTKKKDGITHINEFEFSALCLLGKSDDKNKNVVPCFESSRVEPYEFSAEWTKLFQEFKEELAEAYQLETCEEGGKKTLNIEDVKRMMLEIGAPDDAEIPFALTEDLTEDMVRNILLEIYSQNSEVAQENGEDEKQAEDNNDENADMNLESNYIQDGTIVQPEDNDFQEEQAALVEDGVATEENSEDSNINDGENQNVKFTLEDEEFQLELTSNELRAQLSDRVDELSVWDENQYVCYYLLDFDSKYVYAKFFMDGVNIERRCGCERMSYVVSDGVAQLIPTTAESVRLVWVTKDDEETLAAKEAEFEALSQYKANRIEDDKAKSYTAVLREFSDLADNEEFKQLTVDAMTFDTVEALREKCYALRGKYTTKSIKKPLDTRRFPVGFGINKNEQNDGGKAAFYEKYCGAPKK